MDGMKKAKSLNDRIPDTKRFAAGVFGGNQKLVLIRDRKFGDFFKGPQHRYGERQRRSRQKIIKQIKIWI